MAQKTITAANAVYMLAIAGLFDAPQALQGFSADDVFDTEPVEPAEVQMGVDGFLSAGFVFKETKQGIMLQADSPSVDLFETWYRAQQTASDIFIASGTVTLPGVQRTYAMTRGVLTTYSPMSDAKKVLQPRKFGITWQKISPSSV